MQFSKIEIILMLAYYKVDKVKDLNTFTAQYNRYFNKDFSAQTLQYSISNFKFIDPANNMHHGKTNPEFEDFINVWKEYIDGDKIKDLREIYRVFRNERFFNTIAKVDDDRHASGVQNILLESDFLEIIFDVPKEKPQYSYSDGKLVFPRNKKVAEHALSIAQHKCEANCETNLFLDRCGNLYTEAHHLVPLSFQDGFDFSLDVEANIISLCPNCHSLLHYGQSNEILLRKLFMQRYKRLEKCGIRITFEELLLLYR